MTTLAIAYEEAVRLGLKPKWHDETGTVQIDGHRWDRWYALRSARRPDDRLYVSAQDGTRILYRGQVVADYDLHDEHEQKDFRQSPRRFQIETRPDHARRDRSNPRRATQGKRGSNGRAPREAIRSLSNSSTFAALYGEMA